MKYVKALLFNTNDEILACFGGISWGMGTLGFLRLKFIKCQQTRNKSLYILYNDRLLFMSKNVIYNKIGVYYL